MLTQERLSLSTADSKWLCVWGVCVLSHVRLFAAPWMVALYPWDSPGNNTGVSCHFLFQRIFLTWGSNLSLPYLCIGRRILYHCATWEASSKSVSVLPNKHWASLVAQRVKRLPAMQETRVWSLGQEDPLEKEWQPTPVLLAGKSHGQRSMVGYSPWGHKELNMTERLHFHFQINI